VSELQPKRDAEKRLAHELLRLHPVTIATIRRPARFPSIVKMAKIAGKSFGRPQGVSMTRDETNGRYGSSGSNPTRAQKCGLKKVFKPHWLKAGVRLARLLYGSLC
jgi:hypothetical protein